MPITNANTHRRQRGAATNQRTDREPVQQCAGADHGRHPDRVPPNEGHRRFIVTITLAIAYGSFALRRRKAAQRGTSLQRPSFGGRKGVVTTSLLGTLMTVVGIAYCLIAGSMHAHNGTGGGNIAWTGVAGISTGLLLLVGLSIAHVRGKLSARSTDAL